MGCCCFIRHHWTLKGGFCACAICSKILCADFMVQEIHLLHARFQSLIVSITGQVGVALTRDMLILLNDFFLRQCTLCVHC